MKVRDEEKEWDEGGKGKENNKIFSFSLPKSTPSLKYCTTKNKLKFSFFFGLKVALGLRDF